MSYFYTNCFRRGNNIYIRGYRNGKKFKDIVKYKPYVFMKTKEESPFKSVYGEDLKRIDFDSIKSSRDFIQLHGEHTIFGLTRWEYVYLYDEFGSDMKYDTSLINVLSLDIEVGGVGVRGFPNIEDPDQEVTAITLHNPKTNKGIALGRIDFTPNDSENISYIKREDERDLLREFIRAWRYLDPDIVTGWSIETFDIPYLYRRIRKLLGESEANKLSPFNMVEEKTIFFHGRDTTIFELKGVSTLDYYPIYKKFSFKDQESWKLDHIVFVELGQKKVDYSEYGTINEFYEKNPQLYLEYNIQDTILVSKLENKRAFIEMMIGSAYMTGTNYLDSLTTVTYWDVAAHQFLRDQGKIVSPYREGVRSSSTQMLEGAAVKDIRVGRSKWIVSFDLTSLYPHIIMSCNLSPETLLGRLEGFSSVDDLLNKDLHGYGIDEVRDGCFTANGTVYTRDFPGFYRQMMLKYFNIRKKYKDLMQVAERSGDKGSAVKYNSYQLSTKIAINAFYGATSNKYFRWYSFDIAEAITKTGQLSIRWINNKLNQKLNTILGTENKDFVIGSDTDSTYLTLEELVSKLPAGTPEETIVSALDEFSRTVIQPYIEECYQELADFMNFYEQRLFMKRETIASVGIWKAKKNYALRAWDSEGIRYSIPETKVVGLDSKRAAQFTIKSRSKMSEAIDIMLTGTQKDLEGFIEKYRKEFDEFPFEEYAKPNGVSDVTKYTDTSGHYRAGAQAHIKAAINYNRMLDKLGLTDKYPKIYDGDKMKWVILMKPNPIMEDYIASPGSSLPEEFGLDKYIDKDAQFNKVFFDSINGIAKAIGWSLNSGSTLDDFWL